MKLWNNIFKEIVWNHRYKTALVYEENRMNYAELDMLSDQIARSLRSKGVGKEQIVAVMMERSVECIAAILGVWKAGAAYLCIDLSYPKDRIDFMLKDCNVKVIINHEYLSSLNQMELSDLPTDIESSDLAAVIYTSGSTGNPKGVMLEQKNIAMIYNDIADARYGCEKDVFLINSSTTFVGFLFTLCLSLGHGMETHLSSDRVRKDITHLKKYIEDNTITITFAPPQLAQFLVADNSPLKILYIGSDKAVPFDAKHVQVINLYGLTEVNGPVTAYFCTASVQEDTPIGTPMNSVKVYVLDEELNPVKTGEQGQICFAGAKLARGYLNQPEFTAQKFIKNPFSINEGDNILFLTGDIGREVADGNLEYVNRNDWMVNINGFRVEPGEVENQIKNIPAIKNAVVKGFIDQEKQNYLCAFYTVHSSISDEQIKTEITKFLPDYMIPSFFVELSEIPLNANGKVDRKSLKVPAFSSAIRETYQAPSNEKEVKICKAFQQVLAIQSVGINDNFFMLGGDSIKAMKLQLLCSELGVTMIQIMQAKTPANIAKMVAENSVSLKMIEFFEKKECYPLTENQLGLYYEWEKDNEVLQYNLPEIIKFSKKVDPHKLKVAVEKVIEAHPYLKTCLGTENGQVVQRRQDDQAVCIAVEQAMETEIQNRKETFVKAFELFKGPLYRISIYYTEEHTYLFMDIHHIIVDGSTLGVFNAELAKAYSGEELRAETYTAFEHALEEEQKVGGEKYQAAEKFFDNKLSVTMTELPKNAKGDHKGQAKFVNIDVQGTPITKFCQEHAVTPSNLFLSAFCYTLYRYTGEEKIAITTISHGRNDNKLMNIMGMFVKTLPLVVDISNDQNMLEFIQSVQENMIETIEHEIYPLTKMAEKYKFVPQINYVYQGGMLEAFTLEDQWAEIEVLELDKVKLPLAISIIPKKDDYEISIEYDESLYTHDYIETLTSAVAECAKQIAEKPKTLCQKISIVNDEQIKLLASFNPVHDKQEEQTLQERFEAMVHLHGKHTALIAVDKTLSYAELNASANKIANALIEKGVKPEDKVAFLLPRDSRLICTILGIIKSGGAFIPVDPEYPEERIKYVLEDSNAKFIITTKKNQAELNFNNGLVVEELLLHEEEYNPKTEVNANNLCYIIYTSGSTGKPKGVMIEHQNIVNYVLPLPSNFYINKVLASCSTMLSVTTVAFDVFLEEAFVTLANGLTMVFADEDRANNPMLLASFMINNGVDVMSTTPSRIMQYVEADAFAKALSNVKVIICGGENFPANFFIALRKHTDALIYNTYGPTETTIATNAKQLENEQITIGKALSNVKLYVVDKDLNLLPIGVVGELLIGGSGVGRGYLNQQDLTAEKFIMLSGERVYKSGDYAKWTTTGEIEILGRVDQQIKLRGLRIELGEIEHRINQYKGIITSIVTIRRLQNTDYLCAYFTAKEKINSSDLREYLQKQLTAYMIPSTFTQLDKMPVTPNGKTDVKALPIPVVERQELVLPQNEMQQQLFDLVAGILGTDDFGIIDDLFSVGMTSILAIKMSVAIYNQFNINIKTKDIIRNKTIEQLERVIRNTAQAEEIEVFAKREYYPLTENQRGLYYEWEKDRQALQYNIPKVLKLSKKVDAKKLQSAALQVIEAHPYLKTYLAMKEGELVQLRNDNEPVFIKSARVTEEEVQNIRQVFVQPFDLFNGPLYRIAVYYTDKNTYLFIDIHHIIVDGSALGVFAKELIKAYNGEALRQERYTAFDYAIEEEHMIATERYLVAEHFFDNKLRDGMTELPKVAKGNREGQAKMMVVNLAGKKIETFCKEYAVTPSNLFLSALCNTLNRYTREERIAVTTISSGRDENKLTSIMGMFVKTLPVVVSIQPSKKAVDYVKTVQQNMFETMEHEIYPFTKMAEKHKIVPQINYVYQGGMLERLELAGEAIEIEGLVLNKAKFPLAISVMPRNEDYEISIEYDDGLYTEHYIEILSRAVAESAKQIAEYPKQSCGKLAMISEEEKQKLLNEFQGRFLEYDKNAIFIDLFKNQVEKYPSNIALVDKQSSLTYEQTDMYTDSIAKELIRLGVTENTFVGIMLPRSKEFMLSVIGTMKAGGAYVPLDNEYPQERLEYMLEDSKARVLITQQAIYEQKGMYVENVIFIDEFDFNAERNQDIHFTAPAIEDLAYMIYTSGSTGKPKGVMIRHKSLAAFLAWRSADYELTEKDNLCCNNSFSFDASVHDLFVPLAVGGQLHIISEEMRQNMYELHQYMNEHHITDGSFSTQLGMELLNQFDVPMKSITLGGEKLKAVKNNNTKIVNGYGPTEFTICSSYHVVEQEKDSDNIPIGKPVPNSWAYVVDANNNLMPIGVAGELCIAGVQIALGYWGREDLTKEKFIDNPFKTCAENARMYRTGDLVCWNENGELEYAGRIDNQVKLRGFRIELGEIESVMVKFAGITASVAEIKEFGKAQHLCGYFTANREIDTNQLREHLSQSLAEYMVPAFLITLDNLPLTPNGKVDRKALPMPELQGEAKYVAPRNNVEIILASVFELILGIQQVGIDDSFFALGGDSIKAIRMVSKLREKDICVTAPMVMQGKTIRAISEIAGSQDAISTVDQEAVVGQVPLTFIQTYFFLQNLPHPHHFNQSIVLESAQRIDEIVLRQSLQALSIHHDMLRAVYSVEGGQEIRSTQSQPLYSLVVYKYQQDCKWQSAMEEVCNTMQAGINLSTGPMMQALLFRTPSMDLLFIVIHHLVVDGVSWRILIEDINTAYRQAERNEPITLPAKTASFKAWSQAIQRYRTSYALKQEISYWQKVEQMLPAGRIPVTTIPEDGFGDINIAVNEAQTRALVSTASVVYHTEVNDLLLCALSRAVQQLTGQTTVSVELEGHGREPIGENVPIDRTVGWFTSAYPIVFTEIGADIRHDIRRVKELLRRVPNHGIGYGILQYIGEPALDRHLHPDISFNYLGEISEEHTTERFVVNNQAPQGTAIYEGNTFGAPISINGLVKDKELLMNIRYDKMKYSETMITKLCNAFAQQVKMVIAHCASVQQQEVTAADVGEIAWSDTEFEALLQQTAAKGWEVERVYPLTPMQEGMLFHRLAEPKSTGYFLQSIFRLTKAVSVALVKKALDYLGQQHEVLRTAICYKDLSESRQAILRGREFEVCQIDISGYADAKEQLAMIKRQDIERGFDLQEDSLLRVIIVKVVDNDYRLIWSIHHIIIDGWCLSIMMNDFMNICNTLYSGQEYVIARPRTRTRYEDHVRNLLASDKEAAHTYWKNLLSGYATEAAIRPVGSPARGEEQEQTQTYQFSKEATERLKTICSRYDVTINTAVEAAWGLVLQKYTNTNDVVFGKVVSGRNTGIAGVEEMVGLFINTIPVRVQTDQDETLASLLKKVQQQAIESTKYDSCALSEVQQLTDAGSSLIGTIMAFENYHIAESNVQERDLDFIFDTAREQTNYGISMIAYLQETLTIGISYHTKLYGKDEIIRIIEGMNAVLTANPEQCCNHIAIISKEEQQKILTEFQGQVLDYDKNVTFIDLFKQQVVKNANRIAIVDEQGSLTYEQTDVYTDRIARELVRLGVTRNTFVGIMLPRRKEFMVSVIGTMKAGGAYVPLDNEYPQERIEYMLEDSDAKVLITEKIIYEQKGIQIDNVIFIDEFDFSTECNPEIILTAPTIENLAYMIYTSGSTGKPKGVMIRHKSLTAFLAWRSLDYQLTAEDHLCCHSSFSFDASVYDLFAALVVGGQLHIISEEMRQNMHKLRQYIKEQHITDGTFSTQLGMELLNQFDVPMKSITLGGEKLKAVKKTNTKIVNGYGPTEFTICSSYHVVDQDKDGHNIPIGKPVANSWAYVVDASNNLMPIGVAGELCIAGAQIALGYWRREDLTREKFVDNPFKTCAENDKMYRTGDLVCWNQRGELEYVGRIDNQVKLRGFRIELGEIESAMMKFAGITASVAEIKVAGKAQHLCGYFTANSEINTNQLKEYLSQSLTEYMVPTAFIQLDKIPLTPNGKVDKKVLPALELKSYNEYIAPTNELEERLCTIFAETLEFGTVGIKDSFFDIGGTSLLAMKVVIKAMAMDIEITYANVFKYQTPQKLAAFLDHKVEETVITDVSSYDYRAIDTLLAKNTLGEMTQTPMGDILLAGATGFLGIHILKEFLENYSGKVYCLIRSKASISADRRLITRLAYYFDNDYSEMFGKRIFTVEGDLIDLESIHVPVDTVINCAANVKHFAAGDELEKVNVGGVQSLINYCLKQNIMLIQVSTTSISGVGDTSIKDMKIKESQLYIGQAVDNKYIHSKFLAERDVLAAIDKGLKAKIMRVSNLMSRHTDGEFQLNSKDNSFMRRLKAYKLLGKFPVSLMGASVEFSPIDSTAQAILKLTQTNSEYTVFHPYNNHDIYMSDIIYEMKEYGFAIDIVSDREFEEWLQAKMQDDEMMSAVTGLLAYQDNNKEKPLYVVGRSNEFTMEVLYRLQFKWPITSEVYIKKAIEALDGLGFFDT